MLGAAEFPHAHSRQGPNHKTLLTGKACEMFATIAAESRQRTKQNPMGYLVNFTQGITAGRI